MNAFSLINIGWFVETFINNTLFLILSDIFMGRLIIIIIIIIIMWKQELPEGAVQCPQITYLKEKKNVFIGESNLEHVGFYIGFKVFRRRRISNIVILLTLIW